VLENTRKSFKRGAVTTSAYLDIVIYVSIFLDIFCHDLVTFFCITDGSLKLLNLLHPTFMCLTSDCRKEISQQRLEFSGSVEIAGMPGPLHDLHF
jgi:hypothetical protein